MSTKPATYIICESCGAAHSLTAEQTQSVDPNGRGHQAIDLPCSTCGFTGATHGADSSGTEALRQIAERENGIAG
jgi:hypothetical protein